MATFSDLKHSPQVSKRKCAVSVQNVCKTYGGAEPVLRNISMNVEEGIVYGLLGSSGCGKTTLLSCIVGLKKWESGDIFVMGNKVESENDIMARNIGYMPQDVALYDQLTITEMLRYYSKLYHMSDEKFLEQMTLLEELLDLPGYGSRCITSLSGGQKRRVSLALTLLHSPKLLILDEPTVGLDPLLRVNIWQYLYNLTYTNKTTIIITTHYIEEVKQANMVGVMRKGALLVEDDPAVLMKAHKTVILEEVVLEICRKDRNNRRKSFEALKNNLSQNGDLQSVKVSKVDKRLKWFGKDNKNPDSTVSKKGNITKDVVLANCERTLKKRVTGSIRKTLAYSQVVWINFIRHPMFIFLVLFLPPFQLFSTGIVLGVEPKYTPMGIVNHEIPNWKTTCLEKQEMIAQYENATCDLSKISCDLIKHISKGPYFELVEFANAEDARIAVTRGHVKGYIQIPGNYSTHVVDRAITQIFADVETVDGSTITLHLDMSEFVTMFVALTEIFRSFGDFVKEITSSCNFDLRLIDTPLFYREPVYGSRNSSARDYAVPAMIAGILFEVAFAVTPLVFINDVKLGTQERSRVAGLKFTELMSGLFLTMTSMTVVQAVICYISIQYGLGFEIQGSVVAFVFVCLVVSFCGGALGLIVGIKYKDEFMLVIAAICILPVILIYSGIFRPVEIIPHPFRSLISYLIPSVGIVKPFRFIVNRGAPLTHQMVWPGILVTIAWGVFFCFVCLMLVRRMKR